MTADVLVPDRSVATVISAAAVRPAADVLGDLGVVDGHGPTAAEAATRLASSGPNAVVSHRVRAWSVLLHQLRSGLLVAAAVASSAVGEQSSAVIIVVIVAPSVGLGFINEFRAGKAAVALHSGIRHHAAVVRDGATATVDVVTLVPGDLVELRLGDIDLSDVDLLFTDKTGTLTEGRLGRSGSAPAGRRPSPPAPPRCPPRPCSGYLVAPNRRQGELEGLRFGLLLRNPATPSHAVDRRCHVGVRAC